MKIASVVLVLGLCGCGIETSTKPRSTEKASADVQAQRKELMERLMAEGIFAKVEQPADLPHVWVTPRFHTASFDQKKEFLSVVYAYWYDIPKGGTDTFSPDRMVILKDSQTGKRIGTFTATGLDMD